MDTKLMELPMDMRCCHNQGLLDKVAMFNKHADQHVQSQAINPFSNDVTSRPKLNRHDADYGKPLAGSMTAIRGQRAANHITKEILELCHIINQYGSAYSKKDPRVVISFGELFHIYTCISDKVVGILLRARRQKLVEFEGETLFQHRDEDVMISLTKTIDEIKEHFHKVEEERKKAELEQMQNGAH